MSKTGLGGTGELRKETGGTKERRIRWNRLVEGDNI